VSRPRLLALALALLAAVAVAGLGVRGDLPSLPDSGASLAGQDGTYDVPGVPATTEAATMKPNVVFILVDDLDWSLMPYLPNVNALIRDQGASFPNYYVEQSSCCPSRASILSGLYAHNHGVIGNAWPQGGYDRWKETKQGEDLPVWLSEAGYRTAMLGKYLNEYPYHPGSGLTPDEQETRRSYVPPGWDSWAVPVQGNAYAQFHYRLNVDGQVDPTFREEYLDSVLGDRMMSLVNGTSTDGFDFAEGGQFVYYASYSPHTPYAAPPRYDAEFTTETYPRTPDFDESDVSDKFGLTATRRPLTQETVDHIDEVFRKRIRSLQVLDANVARLFSSLESSGAIDNTYVVFTSDNGYHMGNHRREIGKYTQFQTDVSVPFYVRGPGIAPGSTYDDLVGNIDVAPTIADIAGAAVPPETDGESLLPRLHGGAPLDRRYYLLGRALTPTNRTGAGGLEEPSEKYVETTRSALLNDFTAVTNGRYKLIRYTHLPHEELYDLAHDPYELENLLRDDQASYDAMSPAGKRAVDTLRGALDRLVDCSGVSCR
jgi:N-acetylglucosamine-6-sulfatase